MLIGIIAVLCVSSGTGKETANTIYLEQVEEILIPYGYSLVETSAWGIYGETLTYYIRNDADSRIYEYDGKTIGREVSVPSGYQLVGISEWGGYSNIRSFYFQDITTGRMFRFEEE